MPELTATSSAVRQISKRIDWTRQSTSDEIVRKFTRESHPEITLVDVALMRPDSAAGVASRPAAAPFPN
jgi:hypothetical protein